MKSLSSSLRNPKFQVAAHQKWLLALILVSALILRLIAISTRPLWYDEAFSALFAARGPDTMLQGTLDVNQGQAAEEHPLLYYTLLWGWMGAFGDTPLVVRSFSVIFGMGTVCLLYILGKSLIDERFGLLIASLAAIAPFQVHYSQEVRMYALMAFLLMGATYSIWRGMRRGGLGWWLLFGLCSALAQYTHNLAAFYLVPLALTPLWTKDRRALRAALFSGLGALLLYLPWLLRVPAQFAKIQDNFWIQRPSPARLVTLLLSFVTNLPLPDNWLPFALFLTFFVVALALWQTFKSWRSRDAGFQKGLWLFYLAFGPPILLFIFSQWQPVFIERALLPSGVIFLAWIGWALSQTGVLKGIQVVAFGLLVAGMVLGIYNHVEYAGFPYAPYAELDAFLAETSSEGDVILHSNKLSMLPMVYYDQDLPQRYLADPEGSGADTLAPITQTVLGLITEADMSTAVGNAREVRFVIFQRAIEEYQSLGHGTHPQLQWLNNHFNIKEISNWGDLRLYEYSKE